MTRDLHPAYCQKRIHGSGRMMGGEQCSNKPKPGDPEGLCATHRAAQERADAPRRVEGATRPPEEVTVSTTTAVTLRWAPETGPLFPPNPGWGRSGEVRWRWLRVTFGADLTPGSVSGSGYRLRKNGTESMNRADLGYTIFTDLPTDVQDLFRHTLVAATRGGENDAHHV